MALVMTPIYTQTVGSGGASTITFNNIPQYFTDLRLVASARTASGTDSAYSTQITFNGSTTGYSETLVYGAGSSAASARFSAAYITWGLLINGAGSTANTFSSADIYIPNYTSANFKQFIADSVQENNSTNNQIYVDAALWRNTNPITSISFFSASAPYAEHSTFSLYGIIRSGA